MVSKSEFYFMKTNRTAHLAHLFFTVTEQLRTCKQALRGGVILAFPQLCAVLMPRKRSQL